MTKRQLLIPFTNRSNTHLKTGLPGFIVDGRPVNETTSVYRPTHPGIVNAYRLG